MYLSPILVSILLALAKYYCLTRAQLQQLCMPPGVDTSGRRMRKHLRKLLQAGLINQTRGEVVFPERNGAPAPVFYPSRNGLEYLEVELKQTFSGVSAQTPNWQHLHHWTTVTQFHILLEKAIGKQEKTEVTCAGWLNEWDQVPGNHNEKDPSKKYKLFTEVETHPKRIIFAPDAGMLMTFKSFKKVFYLEIDRATSGIQQIAASKTPGAAAMAEKLMHARHFPETNVNAFSILLVTTSENRREALRKAFATKPGAILWRFLAWSDLQIEQLLFQPIIWTCQGGPIPWFKKQEGDQK